LDREIYAWNDGTKDRKSDPMVLVRRFHQALLELDLDYATIPARLAAADMLRDRKGDSAENRRDLLGGLEAKATSPRSPIAFST
jgi:hypothetical protein